MKELDSIPFQRIKEFESQLSIDGISILDNLISVCYDSYSNEEIFALLDINRIKMDYQNGGRNLINSYFGIGTGNCILSLEEQQRFVKK